MLEQRAESWTVSFLERRRDQPGLRPDKRQYAHPEILETLSAISAGKCFYCERWLSDDERTVDHHLEVHAAPERAFEWSNLYLACDICQRKLPNATIPNAAVVDPCSEDGDPAEHLDFHEEVVIGRTDRGRQTIRKYKLDAESRQLRRLKVLKALLRLLPPPGSALTPSQREALWRLAAPEQPYSLMMRRVLEQAGIPRT
ncbi:MAG: hypothetical protein H6736_15745 [Alphaproteobacteria bacterium]|nr:hypothetical protein [Alphaproteobacteria bacterium]MCB9693264.1 hypothetical protein [Alphaproteobacteria bacterium]